VIEPFEQVVRRHGEVVLRVCRALLGPVDAQDAWQETFLSALQAYPRLRPDSDVKAWLVTIAHRKALDRLRAAGRRALPVDEPPEVPTMDDTAEFDRRLAVAIGELADKQRTAVVARYVADLAYSDVAAMLGGTEAAARRSAADGIANLRTRLKENNDAQ
jgi:RNA polymerase sigma factor (sigma-70 family)